MGRGNEHFYEDIDNIFRWMKTKRRKWVPSEFEVKSLRPTDNFFWNLEIADIPADHHVAPELFDVSEIKVGKQTFEMKMDNTVANRFLVAPARAGSNITLWLGPEFVNFDEPVVVRGRGRFDKAVQPSAKVLLEDVRTRGDRQHPFWAKLHAEQTKWQVVED